jgi:hypothetical protein
MDVTEGVAGHQRDDPDSTAQPLNPKVILTLSPFTGRSIDERLDALSESIRRWDWRTGDVAPRRTTPQPIQRPPLRAVPPALDETAPRRLAETPQYDRVPTAPTVQPVPTAPTTVPVPAALSGPPAPSTRLDFEPPGEPSQGNGTVTGAGPSALLEPPTGPPAVARNPIRLLPPDPDIDEAGEEVTSNVSAPARRRFRRPRREPSTEPSLQAETDVKPQTVEPPRVEPPTVEPPTVDPPTVEPPTVEPWKADVEHPFFHGPDLFASAAVHPVDEPATSEPEALPGEPDGLPTKAPRRFGKLILVVVTVLVVVAIVAIIRSSASSNKGSSDSLTPTSIVQKKSAPPPALVPVSSSVKSNFTAASVNLTAANVTATRALAPGAAQTPAQVAIEVAPYVKALDTFNFYTHYLVWPATLKVPSEDLTLRTNELIQFLSSISSASPATMTTWFAQLHSLARLTETTDNALRKDIGLSPTTAYPTN